MIVLENKKEGERKEREKVFSEKFSEDIKNYKEQGHIKSKATKNYLKCCGDELINCIVIIKQNMKVWCFNFVSYVDDSLHFSLSFTRRPSHSAGIE